MNEKFPSPRSPSTVRALDSFPIFGITLLVGCQAYSLVSPVIRHALLLLGALVCAAYCFYHRRLFIGNVRVMAISLGLCGIFEFFNLLNAGAPGDLREFAYRVIVYLLLFTGVVAGKRLLFFSALDRGVLLVAVALVSGALYIYIANASALTAFVASGRFTGASDLHPVGLAYGYGVCLVLALVIMLADKKWYTAIVGLVFAALLLRGILATGSRGATLAAGISVLVGGVISARVWGWRYVFGTFSVAACLAVVAAVWLASSEAHSDQMRYMWSRLAMSGDAVVDRSFLEREFIWEFYTESFNEWWLIGYSNYVGPYPHNLFFELWLRFGIVGFLMCGALIYLIFRGFNPRYLPKSVVGIALYAVFFFSFVNGQFNLSLEFNRALWLGLGFLLASQINENGRLAGVHPLR